MDPISAFVVDKDEKCFGDIMGLNYNKSKKYVEDRYYEAEGLRVSWVGDTK